MNIFSKITLTFLVITTSVIAGLYAYYPIDGYSSTKIARLARLEKIEKDSTQTLKLPKGALLPLNCIELQLTERKEDSVNAILIEDKAFAEKLKKVIPSGNYSLTILDMTNPKELKYAKHKESIGYQPGSVGKLAVVTALFKQMQNICPESWDARTALLKNKIVKAGEWAIYDHHTIPVYDIEEDKFVKRKVRTDDEFSLYEWLDHTVSVSNNGATNVVWREALLMAAFKDQYEYLTPEQEDAYFKETPKKELTLLANKIVNEPLRDIGISKDEWRLGSFFTSGANKFVGDIGGSIGTPLGLMKYLVTLEQGNLIDENSSLEIKRLLYLTDRRIRYAYSSKLKDAAVYFKSGSLYSCDRSNGKTCGEYAGNVYNYMNSVAIVEHPNGKKYMVCLMTNVLRKNSAYDHMTLASKIDEVINSEEI
ncbi:serine hydrolase [Mesonia sp.]|uniref:serine hydrolase n=1 Tax=Mesonia sp. TaxID=1960830 RepID=UPI003F9D6BA2